MKWTVDIRRGVAIASGLGAQAVAALAEVAVVKPLGVSVVAATGGGAMIIGLCGTLLSGFTAAVQRRSARCRDAQTNFIFLALCLAIGSGLLLALCLWLTASLTAGLFVSEAAHRAEFTHYLRLRVWSLPVMGAFYVTSGVLLGKGQTRAWLVGVMTALLVSTSICVILVRGLGPAPALGMVGAAPAAVIGGICGLAVQGWCVGGAFIRARRRMGRHDIAALGRDAWAMGLQQTSHGFALFTLCALAATFGTQAAATTILTIDITGFALIPIAALSILAVSEVSRALPTGAEAAYVTAKTMARKALIAGAITGAPLALLPRWLLSCFIDDSAQGAQVWLLAMLGAWMPLEGAAAILMSAMFAGGQGASLSRVTTFLQWGFFLPASYAAVRMVGETPLGVLVALVMAWRVAHVTCIFALWQRLRGRLC